MSSNAQIRVAHIVGKWLGGGVESVVLNYYRHMDHSKVQFDFICDEDSANIPYDEIMKLGGRVIICPPYQKLPKYIKFLIKLFRENNYKIVHSHINTLSVFPLYAAKKANVKTRIAHSHSTSNKREWKRNLLKSLLRPFSRKYATDFFACSQVAGRYLFGNKLYNAGLVKIIPNAIDTDKFKFDPVAREKLRKELEIPKNSFVIGHVGRFVKVKNHLFILKTFKKIHDKNPNTYLVLVGQGPLEKQIKQKVKKLELENYVKFLGQRNDIHKIYNTMDLFILPSLYEGLPVVGIEAQAAGLPCIFSDSVTKEVSISESTYFADISEMSSFTNCINKILEIYRQKTLHRKKLISHNYEVSTNAKKLIEFYEQSTQIRVLHLLSTDVFSGAENVACQIINSFMEYNNYQMIYCSPIGANFQNLESRSIPVLELKKFSYNPVRKAISIYKPDIIHAHDAKAILMASLSCKKIKVIGHIHGNHENLRKITPKTLLLNLVSYRVEKFIWVSNSSLDNYTFKNKIIQKSIILYNIINPDELTKLIKLDHNKYKTYDIVYLGRLSYPKNPQRLIHIIEKISKEYNNLKVAMIGDGELKDEIENIINIKQLDNNIDLHGFINNPYKILSSSKIMLMTSRYEGTPMCALEAMSLGKPIVSTPTDGIKDIVISGLNGYLSDDDDKIAKKLLRLIHNEEQYRRFSKNSIRSFRQCNDKKKYIKILKNLYNPDFKEKQ